MYWMAIIHTPNSSHSGAATRLTTGMKLRISRPMARGRKYPSLRASRPRVRGTMASSSAQLKGGKVSSPRTTTSTFSARKPLNGAAMMLASMVKVKNTISSTSTTNSGQRMYSRKLSQLGRLGMKASTQPQLLHGEADQGDEEDQVDRQ